jgi:hypothetical protein
MPLAELLRKRIDATGGSLYAVAKGSGVSYAILHRFYHGERSLRLDNVEKLLDYLGLKVVASKKGGK